MFPMDVTNNLRVFELRREIVNLQQEYRFAAEKDLKFSVKKNISLQLIKLQQELTFMEGKACVTSALYKGGLNSFRLPCP